MCPCHIQMLSALLHHSNGVFCPVLHIDFVLMPVKSGFLSASVVAGIGLLGCNMSSSRTLHMHLFPILPHIRPISYRCLLSITNNRCLDHLLIFQNLFCFIFLCKISNQRKQIFILALLIDQFFISSDSLSYRIEFTFTQTFFFHIYELVFNSALFEKAFCFFAVEAFLDSEYLYVHPCSSLILLFLRYNITVLDSLAYLEYST